MKPILQQLLLPCLFILLSALPCAGRTPGLPDDTLVIGTGWDAARPGDYQPLGMWEPGCLIYETLVNLDNKGRPVPCLARSWHLSTDGKTVTFSLRKGIRFHDGTPFNATAVKANIEKLGRINWRIVHDALETVRVMDETTLQLVLTRPMPLLFIHLAGSGYGIVSPSAIVPKKASTAPGPMMGGKSSGMPGMAKKGMAGMPKPGKTPGMGKTSGMGKMPGGAVARAVGTGPYTWDSESYRRSRAFSVTRNPSYWQGHPVFKRIAWKVIPDPSARAIALETREIHLTGHTPNASLTEESLAVLTRVQGLEIVKSANWGTRMVLINPARPPFDDPRVRQALGMAVDVNAIQALLRDMATVCPGPLAPDTPFTSPALSLAGYDPEKAGELLDAAGIRDRDNDGVREYNGKPLTLGFHISKSRHMALLVCESLKKIGINATLLPREGGAMFEILKRLDYDMAVHPNIPSFYLDLYHTFHSGGRWSAGFNIPGLDRLLDQYAGATDMASFTRTAHKAQEIIQDSRNILFSINESKIAVYDQGLGCFRFPPEEWVGSLQDIWKGCP